MLYYDRRVDVTCTYCRATFQLDGPDGSNLTGVPCPACGLPMAPEPSRPVRLGKYILLRGIASGGMGEVYYAKSEGAAGFTREFAIKRILPHLSADRSFVDMLVKEAKITVLLNHPNVVQVFDLGSEGNEYYIVMEYVPGIAVRDLIAHCATNSLSLPVAVAVHIIASTLKGLAYAHTLRGPIGQTMQILHRDISPPNLLVTRQGWVKVADFGIAKACNEISPTSPGVVKGKFGYIAPEVLTGEAGDQRIDVFSAGVVLWELLAGRRLFLGQNDFVIAKQVLETTPPSISTVRTDVSPELASCIAMALAKAPDQRYRDADSFYDALMCSIRPATADDCARVTAKFLAGCEDAFAGRLAHEDPVCRASSRTSIRTRVVHATTSTPAPRWPRRRVARMSGAAAMLAIAGAISFGLWSGRGGAAKDAGARTKLPAVEREPAPQRPPPPPAPIEPTTAPTPPPSTPAPAPILEHAPANAAPASAPAAEHAPSIAPKARPRPLGANEIQATVQRSFDRMAKCLRRLDPANSPGTIAARLTIAASGRVDDVRLEPALYGTPAGCLEDVMKSMRFRAGPSAFQITIPLSIELNER